MAQKNGTSEQRGHPAPSRGSGRSYSYRQQKHQRVGTLVRGVSSIRNSSTNFKATYAKRHETV
ncbi:hypothetical protein Egran_04727, partial [Elaphomyces granulatus]